MSIDAYITKLPLTAERMGASPFRDLEAAFGRRAGPRRVGAGAGTEGNAAIPADLQAAVNAGSLVSFVEGVNPQDKDDILCCIQIAQRGASGSFDRFTQTRSWYQKYMEILENLGWVGEQFAFAHHDQSQGELRMDQAALAIITAIATQTQLLVLKQAVEALGSLAESDGTIRLFDFHTSSSGSGNFQIGAVQVADNGALSLALGAFYFRSVDSRRRFLFVRWGAQQVNFWTAAQKMTFNSLFYAQHRETVRHKLGSAASSFIAALEVA